MAASPRGGVWVGGADFIDEYKMQAGRITRTIMPIPHEVELAVSGLSLSPDGVMWGAGRSGVTRFDGKRWQLITARDGLLMDFVDVIRAINGSEAWVNYFEPKGATRIRVGKDGRLEFKHYSTQDGLASNSLYLIANDRNGNVWLGGDLGLSIVHPDGTITNQDRSSGLLWNDVSAEAAFEDADGGLFIGTSRGLAYRRPNTPATKNTVPSTVLTSATFAGKEMLFFPNPQIVYKNGTFQAHFAAPALAGPTGLRCKYQLHGLEPEPVETTLSQVRYTALPAGDFLFEVSCGSATRGWSSPVTYNFVVLPPWWQRGWARIAFGILLVLFILWIIALRTRNLEKQRQRLEEAVAARSAELSAANKRLEEASLKDPLTGVRNRRFFEVTTPRDVQQTIRAYQTASTAEPPRDRDLAFFLMDLDHFKNTNDTFGHATGDEVLVAAARRLTSVIRDTDVLVRWGGEEFLIVSQGTSAEGAQHVAQRILDVIGEKSFETSDGHTVLMTCSVGWAVFPWIVKVPVAVPVDEIIKLADRALYQAKQDGRNRAVGLYPDEKLEESPIGQQKARPRAVQVMGPAPVMPKPEKRR
jgi:diguanylate cyclase (GGDEF)-like protein